MFSFFLCFHSKRYQQTIDLREVENDHIEDTALNSVNSIDLINFPFKTSKTGKYAFRIQTNTRYISCFAENEDLPLKLVEKQNKNFIFETEFHNFSSSKTTNIRCTTNETEERHKIEIKIMKKDENSKIWTYLVSTNKTASYRRVKSETIEEQYQLDKCSAHGKYVNESCQCFPGYEGEKCEQTKSVFCIVVYSFIILLAAISLVLQVSRKNLVNIVTSVLIIVSLIFKLISAIDLEINLTAFIITTLAVACLYYSLIGSITIMYNKLQAKDTNIVISILKGSRFVIPAVIIVLSISLHFIFNSYEFSVVSVAFLTTAVFAICFLIPALLFAFNDEFMNLKESKSDMFYALKTSHIYSILATVAFILENIFASFLLSSETMYFSLLYHYVLIFVDIYLVIWIELSMMSSLLSKCTSYTTICESDDDRKESTSIDTQLDAMEEGDQTRSDINQDKYCFSHQRKYNAIMLTGIILQVIVALALIVLLILYIYINPSYPSWEIDTFNSSDYSFYSSNIYLYPNMTIQNKMRTNLIIDSMQLDVKYKNTKVGEISFSDFDVPPRDVLTENMTMSLDIVNALSNVFSIVEELLRNDGIMNLSISGHSFIRAGSLLSMHMLADCPQNIQVLPSISIVTRTSCKFTMDSVSFM